MRVLVIGAGAVGGLLGAVLSLGGAEVSWLVRGERGRRLAAEGLGLTWGAEARLLQPRLAFSPAEAAAGGPFDACLMAVRGMDAAAAAEAVAGLPAPGCLVVMLNGVGHEARLREMLPGRRVLAACLTTACWETAPGRIQAGTKGGVGLECPPDLAGWGKDLAGAFAAGGLEARCYHDGDRLKWSKLLLNLLGSATTAILGWPPARVFGHRPLFDLELAAWREALRVMAALGHRPLPLPGYPVPRYAALVRHLPAALLFPFMGPKLVGGRGDRLPGPAADLARGRERTECEWLGGAVARAGAAAGRPAPVNAALSGLVADLAAGRRRRADFLDRPQELLAFVATQAAPRPDSKPGASP